MRKWKVVVSNIVTRETTLVVIADRAEDAEEIAWERFCKHKNKMKWEIVSDYHVDTWVVED